MRIKLLMFYGVILLAVAVGVSWLVFNRPAIDPELPETVGDSFVVASVNGKPIHALEVNKNLLLNNPELASDPVELRKQQIAILDDLINEKLVIQEAERLNIAVSENEIMARLQSRYESIGKSRVDAFLEESGITLPELKNFIESMLIREKVVEHLSGTFLEDYAVSEEEINQYYEDNKKDYNVSDVGFIFIEVKLPRGEQEERAALDRSQKVLQRIRNGHSFENLAEEFSDDDASKQNGGYIGPMNQGISIKMREALSTLKPGEIYPKPIKITNGYAIVKLINEKYMPLDYLQEQINSELRNQYLREKLSSYLNSLREKAEIEIFLK